MPHSHTLPSFFTPILCFSPAATATQSLSDPIWTGVNLLAFVPSPSCPSSFLPQPHSVPSVLMARVWNPPPAAPGQQRWSSRCHLPSASAPFFHCQDASRFLQYPLPTDRTGCRPMPTGCHRSLGR